LELAQNTAILLSGIKNFAGGLPGTITSPPIEEKKWTQACGMQKQQLIRALGLLWKRVKEITSPDTKIDNEALALALQSQVSFTNAEWDELKVDQTII